MLYKRGNIWWHRFKHKGQEYRFTTGEKNRRAAEAQARRKRVEIEEASGPSVRRGGVALDVLEGLDIRRVQLDGCRGRRTRDIEGLWRPMFDFFGQHHDVHELQAGHIHEYEGHRRKQGVRGQTIRREVQALKRGLKLAKRDRIISGLPFDWDDVDTIKSDRPNARLKGKLWTASEINAILGNLSDKAKRNGVHDQLRFIQLTGLRLGELRRVESSWVWGSILTVPAVGKNHDPRQIPLPPEATEILKRHDKSGPYWPRGKHAKALKLACEKAGFDVVLTARDLRVWFLTEAGKIDPVSAQKLAGHRNIATTSRYLGADQTRALRVMMGAAKATESDDMKSAQRGHSRGGTVKSGSGKR